MTTEFLNIGTFANIFLKSGQCMNKNKLNCFLQKMYQFLISYHFHWLFLNICVGARLKGKKTVFFVMYDYAQNHPYPISILLLLKIFCKLDRFQNFRNIGVYIYLYLLWIWTWSDEKSITTRPQAPVVYMGRGSE